MKENKKAKEVAAIKEGTVLDHIPANKLFKVASLLELHNVKEPITIGNNLVSDKMGTKGIIKIADRFFKQDEINRIALIAPHVVLNVIENYDVVKKSKVALPDQVIGLVRCTNPKCITNNEPVKTYFHVMDKETGKLKCHYCEREIDREDIILI